MYENGIPTYLLPYEQAIRRHRMNRTVMNRTLSMQLLPFPNRGEQPESPALPAHGAPRGDIPLLGTERSEV